MKATTIVHKPPPDFATLGAENAIKHTFDAVHGSWSQKRVQVKLAEDPFARGGLRKAIHMLDLDLAKDYPDITYVAKMSIDPFEDREIYFQDVEMQMYAREWAEKFNSYNPPKRVDFIQAWLIELIDRPGRPMYVSSSS
jgi:elongation factor 2 kinase